MEDKMLKAAIDAVDADIEAKLLDPAMMDMEAHDRALVDSVLRPYLKILATARFKDADAEDFVDATFWLMAILSVEVILNTTDPNDPEALYRRINAKMADLGITVSRMLSDSLAAPKTH